MPIHFADCAQDVARLHRAVKVMERASRLLEVPRLAGREWFELLTQKLLPQLSDDAFLVVAVVGGTNIGKSVVFNHLAGYRASATSPLASGTKHPVCLAPSNFTQHHDLPSIFSGFELVEWTTPEAALEDCEGDRLYWRTSPDVPDNLLVLDTPDIDSDATVNWQRADNVRRSADVLIAILTQQKYNDAAVKHFFRQAAEEDKAVMVVFNQCLLPEDEQYWPMWLDTFCRETGIVPEFVYIAPCDRRAAEENRLPFFERTVAGSPAPAHHANRPSDPDTDGLEISRSLAADLSQLRFGEVKVRTLRGSFRRLLDEGEGVPAYLEEIERRSAEFEAAAELLGAHKLAEIENWPTLPNQYMVAEIRHWWSLQREGWPARIHNFYNAVGTGLAWPFRFANEKLRGEQLPPLEQYRRNEWNSILQAIEKVYKQLQWFSELGNELLRPRLERLLAGTSRSHLLTQLQQAHAGVDLETELQALVSAEMHSFQADSPDFYRFLKRLDAMAAAARPATSLALFVAGLGPAGDAAAQLAATTAMQTVAHVVGDVAAGTATAAVGETAISSTAAAGAGYLEVKFRRMHSAFLAKRAQWLVRMLKEHLLGSLPEELQTAAGVPRSTPFHEVQSALAALQDHLDREDRQPDE